METVASDRLAESFLFQSPCQPRHGSAAQGRGECKNQSTWTSTFLPLFFFMVGFIFVTFECQLGIPYFSKHKIQAISTQGSTSLPLWLASYRAVCKNRLLRLLNQGWKCFKIHLVWGSCFSMLRLEPRVRTPQASTLPLGYTLNLFGDLLTVLIL